MKILILGASGTIGNAIYQNLSSRYEVYGTYNRHKPENIAEECLYKYDIAGCAALDNILDDIKPCLIISSLTGNFEQQLNAHRRIAEYLQESSGRCIFLSTANVFDGSPDKSHSELDIPYPASAYGKYKYSCEQLLQSYLEDKCLIVRLPRTLSPENGLREVREAEKGQAVYENLYKSYNTADNVAKAILFCIESNKYGIVHLTSIDVISDKDYIKRLSSCYDKDFLYEAASFSVESYCDALGCDNPALIRYSDDGNFYLALKSADPDMSEKFGLSCEDVINELRTLYILSKEKPL